ncbi:MAG: hypothetical protein AMXMBFR84_29130 [Candidatus Hydrogenedentota bacterium]
MKRIEQVVRVVWTLATLLLVITTPPVAGQEGEEKILGWDYLSDQLSVSGEFETPHTKWGKPLNGGAVKVVFMVPWSQGSTEAREIVEMMQRFDLEGHAIYFMGDRIVGDGRPDWYGGDPEAGSNRVKRLLGEGQAVFFLNQLTLDAIPEWLNLELRNAVERGAGLVLVGDKATPFEDSLDTDEAARSLPQGRYATLGKGRIVVLPSRERLEFQLGWETTFDYQMQAQGRALLWAAGRDSRADLMWDTSGAPAKLSLTYTGLPEGTAIEVTLRRWDGVSIKLAPVAAKEAETQQIALPHLREGDYQAHAIARVNNLVETWSCTPFAVAADRAIVAVELERDWAERGESVTGRVRFSGVPVEGDTVEARLTDTRGRILDRKRQKAVDGMLIAFDVSDWAPMLLRVEAVLMYAESEISYGYAYLRVPTRNRNQFNFVMWNHATGDLAAYGIEALARYGVTAILQGGPPHLALAANNVAYVPYAASFRASSHTTTAMLDPETGALKGGCVHDPESMAKSVQAVVEGAAEARKLGVFAYSLGDENAVRASCLSPHCLQAYRRYLNDIYADIQSLNREWSTSYPSFDAIELLTEGDLPAADAPEWFRLYFDERTLLHRTDSEGAKDDALDKQIAHGDINDEMRALQAGNFARWYDRQAFQNYSYVEWCKQFQKAFMETDPYAFTGFEGTDSFTIRKLTTRSRQGGDIDLFVREMDYYGSYEGPANEVMRSIAPPEFPMGSWIGYTPDVEELLFKYWQQVTDRMNTIQWWRWDNLDGYNGYLAPNMAPFPATREILEDTQIVRDGLGTLLMQCEIQDDAIGMMYSMPSTYIAHFDNNETFGLYKRDHERWHELIHGAGLQFRYFTDRMLRQGEVDLSRFKAVILPLTFAMSEVEATALREYVHNGGTLIADVRPALYDGHCKPLAAGQLNDVFGVSQTGNRPAREIDRIYIDGTLSDRALIMRWGNWHGKDIYPQMKVDPNVELTTAKGLGEAYYIHFWTGLKAPVCVLNESGKGKAILLNFSLFEAPADSFVRDLLEASGISPSVTVNAAANQSEHDVEITRWKNGNMQIVALLGSQEGPVHVTVPNPGHVFDLKARRYLGETDRFSAELRPNRASFFAVLLGQPGKPEILMPDSAKRGETIHVRVKVPGIDSLRPVRLRLTDPAGTPADWMQRTVITGNQTVATDIRFAFNDDSGAWTLQAEDIITGEVVSRKVDVQ